jgi:YHS domain-containing protein
MAAINSLNARIDAEFSAAEQRAKQLMTDKIQEYRGRQQRLELFVQTLDGLREIWRPRLETLAQKFGQRVAVQPVVEPSQRSATFEFQSDLARIKLRFAVSPDAEVQKLIFTYDLEIIPILMKFDSHDEIEFPLGAIDNEALANWIDDRIVSFAQTYLSIHENQYYLQEHMVEDPIAKVRFPKYAAGATLERQGKTHYFINEDTCREFAEQQQSKNP